MAITYQQPFFLTCYDAEFIAKRVRAWIGAVGAKTAFIAPVSPWGNGYCESLNAGFRDELLNGEIFTTLREAQCRVAFKSETRRVSRLFLPLNMR